MMMLNTQKYVFFYQISKRKFHFTVYIHGFSIFHMHHHHHVVVVVFQWEQNLQRIEMNTMHMEIENFIPTHIFHSIIMEI